MVSSPQLTPSCLHGANLLCLMGRVVALRPAGCWASKQEEPSHRGSIFTEKCGCEPLGGEGTSGQQSGGREETQTGAPWQLWGPATGRAAHVFLRSPFFKETRLARWNGRKGRLSPSTIPELGPSKHRTLPLCREVTGGVRSDLRSVAPEPRPLPDRDNLQLSDCTRAFNLS